MSNNDYYNDEEFREILQEYEAAVTSGQSVFMDADDLADIADYYQQEERYDEAQQAIDLALELQPDSVVALNYKIHQAIDNGDYEAAEEYLSKIIDHDIPEYIYSRAEIWLAQDQVEEADNFLRKCYLDVPPDECQDYVYDVANLYDDYDKDEKALEWLMRGKPENNEDFQELMGRTMFGLGRYDDSERIFNELIDRDPFQKRYWNALANTQFMKEDYGASVTSSEYAIAIDPDDSDGVLAKANGLYHLENHEEALKYYERYSELMPDDEFGYLYQGCCLLNLGRYEEAVERLKEAELKAPDDSPALVDIYQEIGFAYSDMKHPDEALSYLNKTDALDCDHVDMMVVKGHVLMSNQRVKESDDYFSQALSLSDDKPHTMLRILVSYLDNHYLRFFHKSFNILFSKLGDDWKDGYSYMALCCHDLEYYDECLSYLKLAVEKNPKEARQVLSYLFPADMAPADYYDYMAEHIKELKK